MTIGYRNQFGANIQCTINFDNKTIKFGSSHLFNDVTLTRNSYYELLQALQKNNFKLESGKNEE